ncbi:uncharacterized protein RSE6_08281 [Rhynchosporium secalis]|uniref:Phosphoribosylaminoimidazole-succinocarboxamide synthase n=1 Tax=Rhynchosporium secalis TaxID=38038 RepID=A0A1E1MF08_RHYSE|nr:uncharacterized protein RSE6_08281 [Rhynchosporium secalis]
MNLGHLDVHSVHHSRPRVQQADTTSERPITPLNVRLEADRSPSPTSTLSDPTTVVRWVTPPSRIYTPQRSDDTLRSEDTILPDDCHHSIRPNGRAYAHETSLGVRFDEEQIRSIEAEASKRERVMDALSMDSSPPTPVDDTPYIRFAIDQLTRDQDVRLGQRQYTPASSESHPSERVRSDNGLGYMSAEQEREAMRLVRKHRSSPEEGRLFAFNATRPLSLRSTPSQNQVLPRKPSDPEIFIPVELANNTFRHPDLTFVPTILRPLSMFTLSVLCLLMTAALMFCAMFSTYHDGLTPWINGIYGGWYFVFSFLPQILGACVFFYVQCVMNSITRMMPYTMMAMYDTKSRANALFLGVFPRTMLWPSWNGPFSIALANTFFWSSVFTIPLQGCLFSVINVDEVWRWTAVQGVAWTLVAIYLLMMIAAVTTGLFFFRRNTGVMWDPRSLADVIALLPRSNCLRDYPGTDVMRNKEDIRHKLTLRSDRLGYWRTPNRERGIFYCIGEEGASTRQYTMKAGKIQEKPQTAWDVENGEIYSTDARFRYIPWFLKDTFVIFWAVAAFVFLLALFVVAFLPSTAISKGFPPLVSVLPNSAGFSPANFLYSFIPSIIGMLLYLFFQPLDMALRILQPWAELGQPVGATAERSLLLDYPASSPIACSFKALGNGHYRVAFISLLSTLFLIIPILAGGIFFPLVTPAQKVRMIPNLPSFYIILALLVLYLVGLLLLIPRRYEMHLPHGVSCLAEIISFVHASHILKDAAFYEPRSKEDLVARMTGEKTRASSGRRGERNRFAFGVYEGLAGGECLGVERLGRRGGQEVVILGGR